MLTYYDELLPLFVSRDDLRPALQQPNEYRDFVFATDAHACIMVPQDKLINKYPAHEKCVNLGAVIDVLIPLEKPTAFNDTDLFAALKEVPKEPDWKNCEECKGEGEIYCSYCNHKHKCDECEGDGWLPDHSKPKVYVYEGHRIKIGEAFFSPHLIGRLESVVLSLHADNFLLTHACGELKGHLFQINDLKVLLMPVAKAEESDFMKISELKPSKQ